MSNWVKNEAAASDRGVLVRAMTDSVKLNVKFWRKQAMELTNWPENLRVKVLKRYAPALGFGVRSPRRSWCWASAYTCQAVGALPCP